MKTLTRFLVVLLAMSATAVIRRAIVMAVFNCAVPFSFGDVRIPDYLYPFPVNQFAFESQRQELEMTYMDVPPARDGSGVVVLLHGKNFGGAYWEETARALAEDGFADLPPARVDPNQLELAILNLAINARDAMPDGGTLTISTDIVAEDACPEFEAGEFVRLTIADTGHGMAPEVAERAIEPFFSTKPVGKGTGLGLAQVYGIARQSGGTLRIDSKEGEGTAIHLLLPRVAAEIVAVDSDGSPAGPQPRGAGGRILVVDDDPDVRGFLAEALGDLGHRVEAAESGTAALAAFERVAPDLMLIDFAMPGMNGAELAKEVRSRRPDQPMLFVTGYAESDQLEGALADVPILRKPFGVAELAVIVRAHLPENGPRPEGLEAAKA